jgi:hypothetical protein
MVDEYLDEKDLVRCSCTGRRFFLGEICETKVNDDL